MQLILFSSKSFLPTWYTAADFQLYLLNYFLIRLLARKPKAGLILAAAQLAIGSVLVIGYDYIKNIPYYYRLISGIDSTSTFRLEEHYLPTIYHSNTFVIGILTAWAIKTRLRLKFLENTLSLAVATMLAIASILVGLSLPELWETSRFAFHTGRHKSTHPIYRLSSSVVLWNS